MSRRLFDHMFAEVSVAAGIRIPRYALWLELHDLGWNPETMTTADALEFIDTAMEDFLAERGLWVADRARRRLRKLVARFDPDRPTPYERLEAWGSSR